MSNVRLTDEKCLWSTLKEFGKRISVGGISCLYLVMLQKTKEQKKNKKNRKEKKQKNCIQRKFLSFSLGVWLEVLAEWLESLSSYKSQQENCLQCSLELVFTYPFISITISLSLITTNKRPLDLSFAIMILEMWSLCKLMVDLSHLILWAKHVKLNICVIECMSRENVTSLHVVFLKKKKTWNCISMAITHTTLQGWLKGYC